MNLNHQQFAVSTACIILPELGIPLYLPRRSALTNTADWKPYPGEIPETWRNLAADKGFHIHSRVRDKDHLALECEKCGALTAHKVFTLRTAKPACAGCQSRERRAQARRAKLEFLYRDPNNRHYGVYRAPCGHKIKRQFAFIDRVAKGEAEVRCETCTHNREVSEAKKQNWTWLRRDQDDDYRIYRHSCGHEQRIAVVNMRWGQLNCASCGKGWNARKSFIYLLHIEWPQQRKEMLKVGYSRTVAKRYRDQLGLPKDAKVTVLRALLFSTGNEACRREKQMHSELCEHFPESVVPRKELAGLINVVSEMYRVDLLPEIQFLFDELEDKQSPHDK